MNLIRAIIATRRTAPGWAMPMGWFAWFGMVMPIMFELNGWMQNLVFAWTGWLTMWATGCVGTAAIGYESVRNLRRFGVSGLTRPRFCFELSRATLAAIFLCFAPGLTFALFLPWANVPLGNFVDFGQLLGGLVAVFCLSTICGYLLALTSSRKLRGRAYECASWFFCVFGGITLVTFAYIAIPDPPKDLWSAAPGVVGCVFGILLMSCGIFVEATRAKRARAA